MSIPRLCLSIVAGLLIGAGAASSQEIVKIDPRSFCAARPGRIPTEVATFQPTRAAVDAFGSILDRYGLSSKEWQLEQTTATTGSDVDPISKNPRIFYDDDVVRELQTEGAWVARGVLAHEIGHHLNFHFTRDMSRRDRELEADNFAGAALYLMGASEEETARVFRELNGGGNYPSVEDRVTSARNGWRRACDEDPVCTTKPLVSGFGLNVQHSTLVAHRNVQMPPGPGLQLRLQGQLRYSRRSVIGARVQFAFPDGRFLSANLSEPHYRAIGNLVVTGVVEMPFAGGVLELSSLRVDPIPYYVLNLAPGSHTVMAQALFFVDDREIARSNPTAFLVNWW